VQAAFRAGMHVSDNVHIGQIQMDDPISGVFRVEGIHALLVLGKAFQEGIATLLLLDKKQGEIGDEAVVDFQESRPELRHQRQIFVKLFVINTKKSPGLLIANQGF
jgi:hypothetical protein